MDIVKSLVHGHINEHFIMDRDKMSHCGTLSTAPSQISIHSKFVNRFDN